MSTFTGTTAWTDVTTSAKATPGTVVHDNATGKRYCYVYNAGAASTAAGDLVGVFLTEAWGSISMTAATQHVSSDGTTNVTLVAGVAVSTIATTEYGWIQVGGICSSITTDLSIVLGDPMYCADNAKVATTATSAHWHGKFGYALNTDASTSLTSSVLTDCIFDK